MGAAMQSTGDVRWTRTLTGIGIVIAVSNMALAWIVMFSPPMPDDDASAQVPSASAGTAVQTPSEMAAREATATSLTSLATAQPSQEVGSQMRAPLSLPAQDSSSDNLMKTFADLLAASEHGDAISDAQDHSITVVVLAFSFSALAIGFSLFVMGAQGAFALGHEHKDLGSLVVKTTSPGLLIIISAAILMGVVFVARFGVVVAADPEAEAKARVLEAQADAKQTEAYARTDILEAEARVIEARASAYEREAEARASLLEAGLAPEAIDRLRSISDAKGANAQRQTTSELPTKPGLPDLARD